MIFFLELICLLLIIFAPLKSYGLSEGCPRSAAIEARALRLEIEKEVNSGHLRQGDLFAALVNEVETANGVNPAKEGREKDSVCETLVKYQFQVYEAAQNLHKMGIDSTRELIRAFKDLQRFQADCKIEAYREDRTEELKVKLF